MNGVPVDEQWMKRALALARAAGNSGEVPVGAVLVCEGQVIGEGANQPISAYDATAHAEIVAIRRACRKACNYRLPGATLYVTLEPCTMCVGAIIHARIDRVVFGAAEPKAGAVISSNRLFEHPAMNHVVAFSGGVLEQECSSLISAFFAERRARKKQLKQHATSRHNEIK